MTTYKYKGLSPDGAKLSGVIKAYNEFEAVAQLRETCSVITKIEEVKETQSSPYRARRMMTAFHTCAPATTSLKKRSADRSRPT